MNICEDREIESSEHGFITSPSFPEMYPPDQNCTCYIQSNEGIPLQLKSVFFLLKVWKYLSQTFFTNIGIVLFNPFKKISRDDKVLFLIGCFKIID